MDRSIIVQKASGDFQYYDPAKLKKILHLIEVPEKHIKDVLGIVHAEVGKQISTNQIARIVSEHLLTIPRGERFYARYNIKPAIRKLGPGGHVFEQYIARLFEEEGYEVEVGVQVQGKCVTHEIDGVLKRDNCLQMVEAKFHNREGIKSDVTVAMYTYARFLDIRDRKREGCGFTDVWLATNTKPSKDALNYARCQGMKILTVELPEGSSIMDRVINSNLYPIGSIDNLDHYLEQLYQNNYILLEDIEKINQEEAENLGIPEDILRESKLVATAILSPN